MKEKPTYEELERRVQELETIESKHKHIKEDVRESEILFKRLYGKAPLGYQSLDENGHFLIVNQAWLDTLGYTQEEVIGKSFADFLHPDWRDHFKENFPRFKAIGEVLGVEFEMVKNNGDPILVSFTGKISRDEKGNFQQTHCIFNDITERRQAEAALRRNEKDLRESQRIAHVGSWRLDVATNQVVWTEELYNIYGFDPSLPPPPYTEHMKLFTSESWERLSTALAHTRETGTPYTLELETVRKDGRNGWMWVHGEANVNLAGEMVELWGAAQDITVRKRAEEALEKRFVALTQPLDNPEGIEFEDLFVLADIQRLQDEFAQATGVASIITRPDGTPLTVPSNFCRLCNDLIRKTKIGMANCFKSDVALGRPSHDGPTIQPCLSGGLWDAGAAISVGGRHVANWLIGQVRDAEQTEEKMRAYARKIGADETAVAEAFHAVPAMSYERFEKIARVLFTLANQLSTTAYQNVQQARFITERKRAQEELRQSEMRNRLLADMTMEGILLHKNAVAIDLNLAMAKMIGLDRDELLTRNFMELVHADDRSLVLENISKDYASPYTVRMVRNSGEPFFAEIESRNFQQQGDLLRVSAIRDITERKRAEEELRESEERFKALHNASFGGIAIHDQGVILECNQGLSEISGFGVDELIGMDGLLLIAEQSREAVMTHIRSGFDKPYEALGVRKNGEEYPLRLEARNIPYKDKMGRVVEFRDISEPKRAEAERESLQVQLTQAQKMESVGRLAGGVAHDFNNMLGVIIGLADILLIKMAPDHPFHGHLTEIRKAGERSADLTRQLLAFARKQTVAPKVLDFNDTIENMLKLLGRLIGEDIDLLWRPGQGVWPVKMDPAQIDQILANLCVNARDAIGGVGKVTIETNKASFDEEYCTQHMGFVPGDYVLLAVSDNGCGMDTETISHLFEPFFTTKELGKGTGLGLATVYGAVKQNNGFINVYSEPGQGTTFKIYLPRHAVKVAAEIKELKPQAAERGSETILLVEDEPAILRMTTMMLELLGYNVLAAPTPGEALRLAQEHVGGIDLVLTDVVMPEMNGRDLAKNLLSIYPDMRRLFMSGYTANVIAHQGVLDVGVHFMQKPFSLGGLKVKLREVLEG